MSIITRFNYWNRIFKAYVISRNSHLSFWHGTPEIYPIPNLDYPVPYYMKFHYKADYDGQYDDKGIPMRKLFSGNWKKGYIPRFWDGKSSERIVKHLIKIFEC